MVQMTKVLHKKTDKGNLPIRHMEVMKMKKKRKTQRQMKNKIKGINK